MFKGIAKLILKVIEALGPKKKSRTEASKDFAPPGEKPSKLADAAMLGLAGITWVIDKGVRVLKSGWSRSQAHMDPNNDPDVIQSAQYRQSQQVDETRAIVFRSTDTLRNRIMNARMGVMKDIDSSLRGIRTNSSIYRAFPLMRQRMGRLRDADTYNGDRLPSADASGLGVQSAANEIRGNAGAVGSVEFSPMSRGNLTDPVAQQIVASTNASMQNLFTATKRLQAASLSASLDAMAKSNLSLSRGLNSSLQMSMLSNRNLNRNLSYVSKMDQAIVSNGLNELNENIKYNFQTMDQSVSQNLDLTRSASANAFKSISQQLYENEMAEADSHKDEMIGMAKTSSSLGQIIDMIGAQKRALIAAASSAQNVQNAVAEKLNKPIEWIKQIRGMVENLKTGFAKEMGELVGHVLGGSVLFIAGMNKLEMFLSSFTLPGMKKPVMGSLRSRPISGFLVRAFDKLTKKAGLDMEQFIPPEVLSAMHDRGFTLSDDQRKHVDSFLGNVKDKFNKMKSLVKGVSDKDLKEKQKKVGQKVEELKGKTKDATERAEYDSKLALFNGEAAHDILTRASELSAMDFKDEKDGTGFNLKKLADAYTVKKTVYGEDGVASQQTLNLAADFLNKTTKDKKSVPKNKWDLFYDYVRELPWGDARMSGYKDEFFAAINQFFESDPGYKFATLRDEFSHMFSFFQSFFSDEENLELLDLGNLEQLITKSKKAYAEYLSDLGYGRTANNKDSETLFASMMNIIGPSSSTFFALVEYLLSSFGEFDPTDDKRPEYKWLTSKIAAATKKSGLDILNSDLFAQKSLGVSNVKYEASSAEMKKMLGQLQHDALHMNSGAEALWQEDKGNLVFGSNSLEKIHSTQIKHKGLAMADRFEDILRGGGISEEYKMALGRISSEIASGKDPVSAVIDGLQEYWMEDSKLGKLVEAIMSYFKLMATDTGGGGLISNLVMNFVDSVPFIPSCVKYAMRWALETKKTPDSKPMVNQNITQNIVYEKNPGASMNG